jgi:hypothetical protein
MQQMSPAAQQLMPQHVDPAPQSWFVHGGVLHWPSPQYGADSGQTWPQPPQFIGSLFESTLQVTPSQQRKPATQVGQLPPMPPPELDPLLLELTPPELPPELPPDPPPELPPEPLPDPESRAPSTDASLPPRELVAPPHAIAEATTKRATSQPTRLVTLSMPSSTRARTLRAAEGVRTFC